MVTIYALTCLENGKAYIGSTRGPLTKRFREHKSNLNKRKHSEPLLTADWILYGRDAFQMIAFIQLQEDAEIPAIRALEKYAMSQYKERGLLYNMNESAYSPTPEAIMKGYSVAQLNHGNRWTPEANEKRRLSQLGIKKNHGAKISATKKLLGQKPTAEAARLGGIAATKKRWQ